MDSPDLDNRVLDLVNLARASYGAFALDFLLLGQPLSASFCPIGRSLRAGVEDWLFTALGTKYLRLWALEKDPVAVAQQILKAWEIPLRRLKQSGERSGFVLLPLPPELRNFVDEFDHGLLPHCQGQVDPQEVRRLSELARGMPIPGRRRRGNAAGGANPINVSTNISMMGAGLTEINVDDSKAGDWEACSSF